jgi:hypothetical protein
MSQNPTYRFELVRSSDMKLIRNLSEGPAVGRQFVPTLNRPGTFSAQVPIESAVALDLRKRSTGVLVSRNEVPIWSGGVVNIADNASAGTTQFTCVGWLEELDHRFVRAAEVSSLAFSGVTGGAIAQTLISTVNAQTDSGGIVRPTHVGFGSRTDAQVRTRAYKVGDNYGQLLRELVEIENGLDLFVDPLTRRLSTRAPTEYVDRRSVVFGYQVTPHNLADLQRVEDGTTIANRETVATSGNVMVVADDADAIDNAGVMLEEWVSLSDVADATIAGAYANAELVYKRYGTVTYQAKPSDFGDLPRPWDDYQLGDQVYLSVDRGRLQLDRQAVRVFSLTIAVDDNGNEVVSELGVSP